MAYQSQIIDDAPPAGTSCRICRADGHYCQATRYSDTHNAVCGSCFDGTECPTGAAITEHAYQHATDPKPSLKRRAHDLYGINPGDLFRISQVAEGDDILIEVPSGASRVEFKQKLYSSLVAYPPTHKDSFEITLGNQKHQLRVKKSTIPIGALFESPQVKRIKELRVLADSMLRSTSEVVKKYGVSREYIANLRAIAGLPKKRRGRPLIVDCNVTGLIKLIGPETTDEVIGEAIGVHPRRIHALRAGRRWS